MTDINAILPATTPVTVVVEGMIDATTIRSSFESAFANGLSNAGIPAASQTITYGFFSTSFTARVICRTTLQIVTAAQIAYLVAGVAAQASGNATTAQSVTAIGSAGDLVTPDATTTGAGWLDAIGAAIGQVGDVAKWAVILIIIGAVIWLLVDSGALAGVRSAFA